MTMVVRSVMKNRMIFAFIITTVLIMNACKEKLDPLSPGSLEGKYALGMKSLVPLAVGNRWTYSVVLFDTTGTVRTRYIYTLTVKDTITADTNRIPLVPPKVDRKSIKREALLWYLMEGEAGAKTCWQVDSVEHVRIRSSDDSRFYEQSAFNFRAMVGDSTVRRFKGGDTAYWASGDVVITPADSVRSRLISTGGDTVRTTLGSTSYFLYRESYDVRTEYTNYYFKPGFGLIAREIFRRTAGGTMVRIRRDELVSYFFK
jgi:hypothetical protein